MARDILEYSDEELLNEYRQKLMRVSDWAAVNYLTEFERRARVNQAGAAEAQAAELVTLTSDLRTLTQRLVDYTNAIRWLTVAVLVLGIVAAVPAVRDIIEMFSGGG